MPTDMQIKEDKENFIDHPASIQLVGRATDQGGEGAQIGPLVGHPISDVCP
jgi:hypothetical protein